MLTPHRRAPMLGYFVALISVASIAGCSKDTPKGDPSAASSSADVPTFQIVGTPQSASASASASPVASATATTTASAATPNATASATPTAKPGVTATASAPASAAVAPSATTPPAPTAKTVASHVSGKNFGVDASSSGCKVGDTCVVAIRLVVTAAEYHVNKEYPYKFTANASPALQYLGGGDGATFSRSNGDFREDGEKAGVMTVRFKAKSAGDAPVTGTFKLSVCSAENCQIDQANVNLTVPVM